MPETPSSPLSSLSPSWQAVAWVGAPVAMCAALLYMVWTVSVFTAIPPRLDAMEKNLATSVEQQWQVLGTLSRVCWNTSKTDDDRLACLSITYPPKAH